MIYLLIGIGFTLIALLIVNAKKIPFISKTNNIIMSESSGQEKILLSIIDKQNIYIILLIIGMIAMNAGWLYYESQWETVEIYEYEADSGEGGNAIINEDGEVNITTD